MPLTFKLSFEHFDFNDEEFLNDLKRVNHYYDNFVVQPEHLTYTLLDIEMSYYKWLYVDKYDFNKNFKKRV